MHIALDPGGFGTSGAYTVEWEDLSLTAPPPTSTITDFNNFNLGGTYGSWGGGTLTSGPDSYRVEATGFGGGFTAIDANVDGSGDTHVELDVTVNGGAAPHVVIAIEDGDGTQNTYRWFSLEPGDHTLGFRLGTLTDANGSVDPHAID